MTRDLPERVQATGYGWDDTRSSYRIQIGDHSRTIAYAWTPDNGLGDDAVIGDAWEIAKRLIEGWNSRQTPNSKTGE